MASAVTSRSMSSILMPGISAITCISFSFSETSHGGVQLAASGPSCACEARRHVSNIWLIPCWRSFVSRKGSQRVMSIRISRNTSVMVYAGRHAIPCSGITRRRGRNGQLSSLYSASMTSSPDAPESAVAPAVSVPSDDASAVCR